MTVILQLVCQGGKPESGAGGEQHSALRMGLEFEVKFETSELFHTTQNRSL